MAYIEPATLTALRKFAKKRKVVMTEVIRQALVARLTQGEPFVAGFNAGIDAAIEAVKNTKGAQMAFPSGKTFAQMTTIEIERHYMKEVTHEESVNRATQSMPIVQPLLQ
jgi:hypothetical protein